MWYYNDTRVSIITPLSITNGYNCNIPWHSIRIPKVTWRIPKSTRHRHIRMLWQSIYIPMPLDMMYVRVLSWLWTSCDTSRYSKRVNVHIMCTNADRSSKERRYHQTWAHRHVTDVYEDLGSCWILVDTGIEWYTMQTELETYAESWEQYAYSLVEASIGRMHTVHVYRGWSCCN